MTDVKDQSNSRAEGPGTGAGGGGPAPTGGGAPGRRGPRPRVVIAVVVAVAALAALVRVVTADGGGTDADDVRTGAGGGDAATVGIVHVGALGVAAPLDFVARIVGPDGATVAERSWSEVEEPLPDAAARAETDPDLADEVSAGRGLLEDVPAGDLVLEATVVRDGETLTCDQPFTAAAGDRLILRVQLGAEVPDMTPDGREVTDCATVGTVDEWAGSTSPGGEAYLGLTPADAEARAAREGYEVRVVGVDGLGLARTDDLRPDRIDLTYFDDAVVSAVVGADLLEELDTASPRPDEQPGG